MDIVIKPLNVDLLAEDAEREVYQRCELLAKRIGPLAPFLQKIVATEYRLRRGLSTWNFELTFETDGPPRGMLSIPVGNISNPVWTRTLRAHIRMAPKSYARLKEASKEWMP